MGTGYSEPTQEHYDMFYSTMLEHISEHPNFVSKFDIGIDESLLKYSGTDSNAQLMAYSNELLTKVPGYIARLGSSLGPITSAPNAVGIGALVISMIMEICILSTTQTNDNPYSMLQRIFGEEKASSVRDTMSEYLNRHQTFIDNEQRLREELRRLEAQLSNHLTILRNSLLHDGQMGTRGFKIWVNGASFHLQMLIHEARLNPQTGKRASAYQTAITRAISSYLQNLDDLLKKFKTFIRTGEPQGEKGDFLDYLFLNYEPISGLKSHFLNVNNNLLTLIKQHDTFTLPSRN
ncbi:uncharacterized protein LOC119886663 [Micropterus salmoides]|uniref:uncharacterized protein LOC119886663 n=1 Tax=Micropterus salmoides TaxID=27706 RepID=UPI0018EB00B3|nr:uncharacterized protein LOC119886663 [Micropterus salmoides]